MSKGKNSNCLFIIILPLIERAEPVARSSVQQQRAPIRENIHTEAILNVHSIDASNVLTGSQDRVGDAFVHLKLSLNIISTDFSLV